MQKMNRKTSFNIGRFGCHEWVGGLEHGTYGKITVAWPDGQKCRERTHRIAYMAAHKCLKSDLPRTDDSGRKLDVSHLCHNGRCINPAHLVLEPHETNLERMSCKCQKQCSKIASTILFNISKGLFLNFNSFRLVIFGIIVITAELLCLYGQ